MEGVIQLIREVYPNHPQIEKHISRLCALPPSADTVELFRTLMMPLFGELVPVGVDVDLYTKHMLERVRAMFYPSGDKSAFANEAEFLANESILQDLYIYRHNQPVMTESYVFPFIDKPREYVGANKGRYAVVLPDKGLPFEVKIATPQDPPYDTSRPFTFEGESVAEFNLFKEQLITLVLPKLIAPDGLLADDFESYMQEFGYDRETALANYIYPGDTSLLFMGFSSINKKVTQRSCAITPRVEMSDKPFDPKNPVDKSATTNAKEYFNTVLPALAEKKQTEIHFVMANARIDINLKRQERVTNDRTCRWTYNFMLKSAIVTDIHYAYVPSMFVTRRKKRASSPSQLALPAPKKVCAALAPAEDRNEEEIE